MVPVAAPDLPSRFAALESRYGGRIGVAALDTGTRRRVSWRGGERFAMASTFKWTLAARILAQVDAGARSLDAPVHYGKADLMENSPVTEEHVAQGVLRVGDLCKATIQVSDNTAANLLLRLVDGPAGLTAWLRAIGDPATRLDRDEPTLNANEPGDPRDTTTPDAMVGTLEALLVGDVLRPASRRQLNEWMEGTSTGLDRIRAGLPPGWRVGDKTGTGARGATNDMAIATPPGHAPIVLCTLYDGEARPLEDRKAALREAAKLVAGALTPTTPADAPPGR